MSIAKLYLKYCFKNSESRRLRLAFRGKRLIILQYNWLHFTGHPWEFDKK